MQLKIFETVHSLMNYMNLIDSCQAHLSVQNASNIELIRQSDTGVVIDSEPHRVARAKQASCLLHWLSMFKLAVPFSVLHSDKTVKAIIFKYKTVLIPKLKIAFIF